MERVNGKSAKLLTFLCFLVYSTAYIGRYSYNASVAAIESIFSVTKAEAGLSTTLFFFTYGVGQVVNGFLCKYYNKRYVVTASLLLSAAINFAVAAGVPFAVYKYLWLVNGVAQSVFWTSLLSTLGANLSDEDLTGAKFAMGATVALGTVVVYGLSAIFIAIGNFRLTFLMAGVVCSAVAVVWFIGVKACGATTKTEGVQARGTEKTVKEKKPLSKTTVFIIAILAFFSIVNNFVKDGLGLWVPSMLTDIYGLDESVSTGLSIALPAFSLFSTLLVIALEKRSKNPVLLSTGLYILTAVLTGLVVLTNGQGFIPFLILFSLVSLLMHAINNLVTSIAPLNFRNEMDAGKLAGILNGFCYVGSTLSSYGLGAIADAFSFDGAFLLLFITVSVAALLGVIATVLLKKITPDGANK